MNRVWSLTTGLAMAVAAGIIGLATMPEALAQAGNCAEFTAGSSSYIEVPSSDELKVVGPMTMEAWIRPITGCREWALVFGKQYNPADSNPWYCYRLCASYFSSFPGKINYNVAPEGAGENGATSGSDILLDTWTHVAGVYDRKNLTIYINGVPESSTPLTSDMRTSDLPLYIGKAPWTPNNNFNGRMDEVRVWNVARTQDEIKYAMKRSLVGDEAGLVAYWRFDDTPGSGTTVDSANANTGTLYNGAAIVAGSDAPLGLVSWWQAEGNADDSIDGNDGTMENGATFAAGKVGQAFSLDGDDDAVRVEASANLHVTSFTVAAWINPAVDGISRPVVEWNNETGVSPAFGPHLWVRDDGSLYGNITEVGGTAVQTDVGLVSAGRWTHVAFTYDEPSGVSSLYVDGAQAVTGTVGSPGLHTEYAFFIGRRPSSHNGPGEVVSFNGLIDQVELHGRALSAAEVFELCRPIPSTELRLWLKADAGITKDGSDLVSLWADQSGNGFDVVQGTGTKQPLLAAAASNGRPAVRFDGNDDYLQTAGTINLLAGAANYTMFIVTKPAAVQKQYADIVDYTHNINVNFVTQQYDNATNQYGWINWQPLSDGAYQVFSDVFVDDTSYTTYVNGVNPIQSVVPSITWAEPNFFTVGNKSLEAIERQFAGDVAEVIVYNTAMSDTEREAVESYLIDKYGIDITPDSFSFTDQTGVALSQAVTSDAIVVADIDYMTSIGITGGEYEINTSGSWSSSVGAVRLGDSVRVRLTSSASYGVTVDATLTIGGVSDTFSATTEFQYMLTYHAGPNGTVDGIAEVTQLVVEGNDGASVTAMPDTGYHFVDWSDTSTDNPRQDLSVSGDLAVTANFAINEYRVEFVTDGTEGATLTGALVQTVTHGGDCTPVTVETPPGNEFLTWSGGYVGADNPLTVTNVTSDLTVTANFQMEQVACGSTLVMAAEDVSLAAFHLKPKVYATYFDPVKDPGQEKPKKASLKVLTKVDKALGTATLACEWTKKIRLYDAKAFKASEAGGIGAAGWITEAYQHDLVLDLHLVSKEAEDQSVQPLALAAPVIANIADGGQDAKGNDLLVITGTWFGTKKPKVWREYEVDDGSGGTIIKRQTMKVVKPTLDNTDYLDSKLNPAYMDAGTGESKVIVIVPADPKGALNGAIVLENGVGMGAYTLDN